MARPAALTANASTSSFWGKGVICVPARRISTVSIISIVISISGVMTPEATG